MNRTLLSFIGMAAIGVSAFLYMGQLGLPIGVFDRQKSASMTVNDTNGLVAGSRVLVRGVETGHVTKVVPSAVGVEVTLEYPADRSIPVDSGFKIETLSALGESFVAVTPATADGPYLLDAARIDSARVANPPTFQDLAERVTRLLEQVDVGDVRKILEVFDVALPGPCDDAPRGSCDIDEKEVTSNLSYAGKTLASTISEQSDNLTTLLSSLQPLLVQSGNVPQSLRAAAPVAEGFGTSFSGVQDSLKFAVLKGGPLGTGVEEGAGPFLTELQRFLDNTAADLHTVGNNLLPGVSSGASSLRSVDAGRLLDLAMSAVGDDAVRIHVDLPGS